jgi:deoxycytidine triphosphate deaminase
MLGSALTVRADRTSMAFFSDATIRRYMARGELVIGGKESMAEHNSYQFRAGKIFHPGKEGKVIDWTLHGPADECRVEPGHLVWIRVREQVKLPHDVCAFWWQTNGLSRKGLMLVNMSMVEPGYKGPLACLFVNFGQAPVVIDPQLPVAKLVFATLDQPAEVPFRSGASLESYDRTIRDVALHGPPSFLRVAELATSIAGQRDEALKRIEEEKTNALREAEKRMAELERAMRTAMDAVRDAAVKDLQTDLKGTVLRYIGLPAALVMLFILAVNYVPQVRALYKPELESAIRKAVADEVSRRIVVTGTPVVDSGTIRNGSAQPSAATPPSSEAKARNGR